MQGERVKKYTKLQEKKVHFDGNLEESKDIINNGKGTLVCGLQCTINRALSMLFWGFKYLSFSVKLFI